MTQTVSATRTVISTDTLPSDVFSVINGGFLEFGGVIEPGTQVSVASADAAASTAASTVKVDQTINFQGNLVFNDGLVDLGGLSQYGSTDILDWHLDGNVLSMDTRGGQYVHFNFTDATPTAGHGTNIQVAQLGDEFYITEGNLHQPAGATLLNGQVNTPSTPAVAIYDTTSKTNVPDTFTQAYTGPVAGVALQTIDITPHSLNIAAQADSLFIKTGTGNDAIALHGGTNVVDAGGGSNFLTASNSGQDTFFLDTRGTPKLPTAAGPVPGAIWDTIQGFTHGDAVTFWGINSYDHLEWQRNEGAVGHTGITLHTLGANSGSEASLTFAGMKDTAGLTLSYGNSGGANYLYVKAA